VASLLVEADCRVEPLSRLASNKRPRFGTRRSAWPTWAWCPSPASLYAPIGWIDLPMLPPDWVVKIRWTRTALIENAPSNQVLAPTSPNSSLRSLPPLSLDEEGSLPVRLTLKCQLSSILSTSIRSTSVINRIPLTSAASRVKAAMSSRDKCSRANFRLPAMSWRKPWPRRS